MQCDSTTQAAELGDAHMVTTPVTSNSAKTLGWLGQRPLMSL